MPGQEHMRAVGIWNLSSYPCVVVSAPTLLPGVEWSNCTWTGSLAEDCDSATGPGCSVIHTVVSCNEGEQTTVLVVAADSWRLAVSPVSRPRSSQCV